MKKELSIYAEKSSLIITWYFSKQTPKFKMFLHPVAIIGGPVSHAYRALGSVCSSNNNGRVKILCDRLREGREYGYSNLHVGWEMPSAQVLFHLQICVGKRGIAWHPIAA
jgi:hypothetical protein